MKILVLLAQIALALSAAGYGYWLFQWHRDHPPVVATVEPTSPQPAAPPSDQMVRQGLVEQWIKGNLSDPAAKIVQWTQVIPVEDRQCVVVTIQGKTRGGRLITRTYVFEFRDENLLSTTSGHGYLESLETEAKSSPTTEQEKRLRTAYEHLKKALDQLAVNDSPTS